MIDQTSPLKSPPPRTRLRKAILQADTEKGAISRAAFTFGIDVATMSRILSGYTAPTDRQRAAMCTILKMTERQLGI